MILEPFADIAPEHFNYDLPEERIALFPADIRDNSRLLIRKPDGKLHQDLFRNVAGYLPAGTHIFMNNSKVIPARLVFTGNSGSRIELLCLRPLEPSGYALSLSSGKTCIWECMVGNLKRFRAGPLLMHIVVNNVNICLRAEKLWHHENIAGIRFSWDPAAVSFGVVLSGAGKTPLPPYIKREAVEKDRERYQTVYSKHDGSVAAPTAGFHFTASVFEQLRQKGITWHDLTLHVGAGTFQPVKSGRITEHEMHAEIFYLDRELMRNLIKLDSKVTCVGTTSVRTLESIYWLGVKILHSGDVPGCRLQIGQWEPYGLPRQYSIQESFKALWEWLVKQDELTFAASTQLMIVPGYDFRVTDALITNFHQPRSTLLLLIAAFIGESWKEVYQYALENGFRFLSYGDSSLLFR